MHLSKDTIQQQRVGMCLIYYDEVQLSLSNATGHDSCIVQRITKHCTQDIADPEVVGQGQKVINLPQLKFALVKGLGLD